MYEFGNQPFTWFSYACIWFYLPAIYKVFPEVQVLLINSTGNFEHFILYKEEF